MARAKALDTANLSAEDAAELKEAINECDAMLAETIVDAEKTAHAKQRLDAILIRLGEKDAPEKMTDAQIRLTDLLHRLSDLAYRVIGPRGYSDALLRRK